MQIINNIHTYKKYYNTIKNKTIGFVPTMGALHNGHISLCKESIKYNDITIVSIFINPTQFNNKQDLTTYPKDITQDLNILKKYKIDGVFVPEYQEIYQDDFNYQMTENNFSKILEGKFRPGHFTGVLTIVLKLLNIIKPNNIYMGEKDYQQAILIKNMIDAFFIDTKINICPTIRDDSGLALSSRNKKLSDQDLIKAKEFNKILKNNQSIYNKKQQLEQLGFTVEYIENINNRILSAVQINNIRLIDNIGFEN